MVSSKLLSRCGSTDTILQLQGGKIIKPSDWNMKQSELAVTVGAQMNEQRMYQ